jgi:hypothetical protein
MDSPSGRTSAQDSGPRADARRLPFYSRGFNPIEKSFAKLKARLRKAAGRTVDALWDTIGRCIDLFTPAEDANYFASCSHEADGAESALALLWQIMREQRPAVGTSARV